jgi:hypothetical protein
MNCLNTSAKVFLGLALCIVSASLFYACGEGFRSQIASFTALTQDGTIPADNISKFPAPGDVDYDNPASDNDATETNPSDGSGGSSGGGGSGGSGSGSGSGGSGSIDASCGNDVVGRYFKLELLDAAKQTFQYAIHTRLGERVVPITIRKPVRVAADCTPSKPITDSDVVAFPRPHASGAEVCIEVTVYEGKANDLKQILQKKVCQNLK